MMDQQSKIYVAGHRGLAGSAIIRQLNRKGYRNLVLRTHAELELAEQAAVRDFFQRERPDYVFIAAAKVGGIVAVDPRYFRPTEVDSLLGDPAKAKAKLGWSPKVKFGELVAEMVREDLRSAERDELVKRHGHKTFDRHE